jgi:Transcription elongation factor, GreA/GreB, C-term
VPPLDKKTLLETLCAKLKADLERVTRRAVDAAEAASHEENRPEGDKDMRSTEASYFARGQAERARAIEEALAKLGGMRVRDFGPSDPIAASALVELDQDGRTTLYFVLPAAGGERLSAAAAGAEREVLTLATSSPLGAALLGLVEGDDVDVTTPTGRRNYEIAAVR